MPSSTPKQARFMAAVGHDPAFARKVGVPMKVGEDFNEADKGTGILKKPSNPGKAFGVKKTRSWTGM